MVSGIEALVQQVITELLSDFDVNLGRGAGLESIISAAAPADKGATKGQIITAISSARAHILANQQAGFELLPSERLKTLSVLKVDSLDGFSWDIEIQVVNFENEAVTTSLAL